VRDGEIGNLWVRGASAFAEYWRIPELTARTNAGIGSRPATNSFAIRMDTSTTAGARTTC